MCFESSVAIFTGDFSLYMSYRSYQIGVEINSALRRRQTHEFGHFIESPEKYIAAELPKESVKKDPEFEIGDNEVYGEYFNPILMEGGTYILYIGYVSRFNETVSTNQYVACELKL